MGTSRLRINGSRLRASLEEMAKIGATPGCGVQRVLDTAGDLGYSHLHMVSGAGHDASYMNQVCATVS
jgi:hypothetical protein